MNKMSSASASARRVAGFTLIELMIVVAVVAILAAIAYPSYQEQVRKSRRAQAKADLTELAQGLERRHTVQNTYDGAALPFEVSPRDGRSFYNLSFSDGPDQSSFTLQAVPINGQEQDRCGTLTLDQAGIKTPNNATVEGCW